jgi:PhnB protein
MRLNPHLSFNGNCEAAFRLYEKCLGGKVMLIRYENTPLAETVPSDWQKKILHTTLTVGNYLLQGVDLLPGQ